MVTLTTDQPRCGLREPIVFTLTIANPSSDPAFLSFRTGQRYELTIEDERGRVVWRWSVAMMFTPRIGAETVWPGRSLLYQERYEGPLAAGTYRVTGRAGAGRHGADHGRAIGVVPGLATSGSMTIIVIWKRPQYPA